MKNIPPCIQNILSPRLKKKWLQMWIRFREINVLSVQTHRVTTECGEVIVCGRFPWLRNECWEWLRILNIVSNTYLAIWCLTSGKLHSYSEWTDGYILQKGKEKSALMELFGADGKKRTFGCQRPLAKTLFFHHWNNNKQKTIKMSFRLKLCFSSFSSFPLSVGILN